MKGSLFPFLLICDSLFSWSCLGRWRYGKLLGTTSARNTVSPSCAAPRRQTQPRGRHYYLFRTMRSPVQHGQSLKQLLEDASSFFLAFFADASEQCRRVVGGGATGSYGPRSARIVKTTIITLLPEYVPPWWQHHNLLPPLSANNKKKDNNSNFFTCRRPCSCCSFDVQLRRIPVAPLRPPASDEAPSTTTTRSLRQKPQQ